MKEKKKKPPKTEASGDSFKLIVTYIKTPIVKATANNAVRQYFSR